MPEKLALQQTLRECGAVLGHEELVAPARPVVYRRRNEALARPRLPLDQNGNPRVDNFGEMGRDLSHSIAIANDLCVSAAPPLLLTPFEEAILLF